MFQFLLVRLIAMSYEISKDGGRADFVSLNFQEVTKKFEKLAVISPLSVKIPRFLVFSFQL